jgi:hypothetical protein
VSAITVTVRNGGSLLTDGPFTEIKEFIAGFDILDCADSTMRFEAARLAAKHPLAHHHMIEVSQFAGHEFGDAVA